ncbi:hypothetical protein JHK82_031088 [Glycine max]|nr:hypothetical protein JHK86_031185 [Glycine max]KAG5124351.1 hypothetical protein JHK82_031088 [Glycine max]
MGDEFHALGSRREQHNYSNRKNCTRAMEIDLLSRIFEDFLKQIKSWERHVLDLELE